MAFSQHNCENKNDPWWTFSYYYSPMYRSCGELVPRDKSTIKRHQGIYTKKKSRTTFVTTTSVQIITLYAQFLSRNFKSVDSIRNYISAIKLLHLDLEYPQFESFHFKSILKGLSRLNPHRTNQAQPITPYMLCDMF